MKKNKFLLSIRVAITICAALGWWGVLYPELTMTPDTYRVVCEEASVQERAETEWDFDNHIYETVLSTDRSRIRFRSRLLMNVTALYEQGRDIDESGK